MIGRLEDIPLTHCITTLITRQPASCNEIAMTVGVKRRLSQKGKLKEARGGLAGPGRYIP